MRILVVGGGGREHALCWALRRDVPEASLFAAPGNPGTAALATNLQVSAGDIPALVQAVVEHKIDLTVVGPEAPLAAGLVDELRKKDRHVFGPTRAAAELEWSKAFAKKLMHDIGVPTAKSGTFRELDAAGKWISSHRGPVVVKVSGLAAGKGVIACSTGDEALNAASAILVDRKFADAGAEIVVEEFLTGEELSVLALTDGKEILILPPAQDHKRLLEGDQGPNTGGMGAYCPVSLVSDALLARVRREVFEPVLAQMSKLGRPYQGVLYAGLMITNGTPNVLEFNCRFGDPETQAMLPLIPGIMKDVAAIAMGEWRSKAQVLPAAGAAVTTVLAARGYPDSPDQGAAITIPTDLDPGVLVFHAGTKRDAAGQLRVSGGRVLTVTGVANTVRDAAAASRAACGRISFEGMQYRRDIGWREIARAGAA